LSKDISNKLCDLMLSIKLRVNESSIDVSSSVGTVFKNSFVAEGDLAKAKIEIIAEVWVDIEDNEEVMNVIIGNELQEIGDEMSENS